MNNSSNVLNEVLSETDYDSFLANTDITTENNNLFEGFANQATIYDFIEISNLFRLATEYYRNKGIEQWQNGYDLMRIYQSIINQETFIIRNNVGILLCTFAVSNYLPDYYPEYLKQQTNILHVKSFCKNMQIKNFVGRKIIVKVIESATNSCVQKIYLDCVMDNPTLELCYKRYGFKRVAIAEHPKYAQNMVIMVHNIQYDNS